MTRQPAVAETFSWLTDNVIHRLIIEFQSGRRYLKHESYVNFAHGWMLRDSLLEYFFSLKLKGWG